MIFALIPLLILFGGLAVGSAYMHFKEERAAKPKITIASEYRTRPKK